MDNYLITYSKAKGHLEYDEQQVCRNYTTPVPRFTKEPYVGIYFLIGVENIRKLAIFRNYFLR